MKHTVNPGETLTVIARRYGLSLNELAAANNLPNVNLIKVGQVLTIPQKAESKDVKSLALTLSMFEKMFPKLPPKRIADLLPGLNETLDRFEINTLARVCCFLAQCAHESLGLLDTKENGDTSYFDRYLPNTKIGRQLGNTLPQDAANFCGRGFIQLTGRYNYDQAGKFLAIDLVSNPEKVSEDLRVAWLVSGYFWQREKLNSLADKVILADGVINRKAFAAITRKINGGNRGAAQRFKWLESILSAIKEIDYV